jgi:hypothetical protein
LPGLVHTFLFRFPFIILSVIIVIMKITGTGEHPTSLQVQHHALRNRQTIPAIPLFHLCGRVQSETLLWWFDGITTWMPSEGPTATRIRAP